jgi:hypothetical protein
MRTNLTLSARTRGRPSRAADRLNLAMAGSAHWLG